MVRHCDRASRFLVALERWVSQYAGGEVPARRPGDGKLQSIEDAPGSYVKVRAAD